MEELGKIAGIAGIAVGALVVLYGAVIDRTKQRTSKQTRQLLNGIVLAAFVVAIGGIAAWVYGTGRPAQAALAAERSECLSKLAPSSNALIDAGGTVSAGRNISICAENLDGGAIRARCGDVRAETIEAIIGSNCASQQAQ